MLNRAATEAEITAWADLLGWHPPDLVSGLLKVLLDDAVRQAEKLGEQSPEAVMMALIVEQQKVLSNWSKVIVKKG